MHIIYTADAGWQLNEKLGPDDYYVGHAADSVFPYDAFTDLDSYILSQPPCKIWLGGSQYRSRPNSIPYYLNKYIIDYPRQISARQLLIARYLNTHFLTMARFRIGMTCATPACVEITHMIPYGYYPRTKKGQIASQTIIVAPVAAEMSEEQKNAVRARVERALKTPDPLDIMSILPSSGRTAKDFTPAELAELERAKQPKTTEEEDTNLDSIGIPTTRKQ